MCLKYGRTYKLRAYKIQSVLLTIRVKSNAPNVGYSKNLEPAGYVGNVTKHFSISHTKPANLTGEGGNFRNSPPS